MYRLFGSDALVGKKSYSDVIDLDDQEVRGVQQGPILSNW